MPFGKITKSMIYPKKYRNKKKRIVRKSSLPSKQARIARTPSTVEYKFCDDGTETVAANTTGVVVCLNDEITQGSDADSNRIGNKIQMKSIALNIENKATATTGLNQSHRVMLVYDKETNGVLPTVTDIFNSTNNLMYRHRSVLNNTRFVVLMDRYVTLQSDTTGQNTCIWDKYVKLDSEEMFLNNSGDITGVGRGGLYLVVIGEIVAGVTAGTLTYNSRLRYTDD